MKERNFLADLLSKQANQPMMPVGGQQPVQPTQVAAQAQDAGLVNALATQQKFTPTSVLDSREALANSLVQQSQDRNVHPLARGIAAYFGTKQMNEIGKERAKTEAELARIAEEKEAQKIQREQDRFDREIGVQERGLEQKAQQFEQSLSLEREKFNQEKLRDSEKNAVVKVKDAKGETDLLFKGNAPVTDGLEKGLQWGIDKDGNRVAVPIPTQPNEKAANQVSLIKETVDRLLNNTDGVKANYGALDQYLPSVSESARDAETDLNQLRALLTVDNLSLMTGVLSETDIKILQNVAGGGIAETASEKGAMEALKRIKNSLGSAEVEIQGRTEPEGVIDYTEYLK